MTETTTPSPTIMVQTTSDDPLNPVEIVALLTEIARRILTQPTTAPAAAA